MKLTPINPHFNACDQQWELMPEQEHGGRLCDACERVLVDFSPLTDQQMLNLHRTSDTKLCGRYTQSQVDRLHRHLVMEEAQARPWLVSLAMGIGAALPFSLAAQQAIEEPEKLLIGDTIIMPKPINIDEGPAISAAPPIDSGEVTLPIAYTVPIPGAPGGIRYPQLVVDNTTAPEDTSLIKVDPLLWDNKYDVELKPIVWHELLVLGMMYDPRLETKPLSLPHELEQKLQEVLKFAHSSGLYIEPEPTENNSTAQLNPLKPSIAEEDTPPEEPEPASPEKKAYLREEDLNWQPIKVLTIGQKLLNWLNPGNRRF